MERLRSHGVKLTMAMIALVREWLPFVGLVVLGWLLAKAITIAYESLSKRIDAKVPDDMP